MNLDKHLIVHLSYIIPTTKSHCLLEEKNYIGSFLRVPDLNSSAYYNGTIHFKANLNLV